MIKTLGNTKLTIMPRVMSILTAYFLRDFKEQEAVVEESSRPASSLSSL